MNNTTCLIKVHDTTGDAELIIYKDNMRQGSEMVYLEDGGLNRALAIAKTISASKPIVRTV